MSDYGSKDLRSDQPAAPITLKAESPTRHQRHGIALQRAVLHIALSACAG